MNWRTVGIIALLIGILLRVASIQWNSVLIHGDVNIDVSAATSFHETGKLMATNEESSVPLAQHGPVWAILGSAYPDAYVGLRIASLLSGLLVLALLFLLGRKLLRGDGAWILVGWAALSWLLVDYSGNGSLYSFQTALYLLWTLIVLQPGLRWRAVLLGLVSGVTYLLNFQAIILVPASVIVLLIPVGEPLGSPSAKLKLRLPERVRNAITTLIVVIAVASPWLLRNALLFGDPFYHHAINSIYVIQKAGFAHLMDEHLRIPLGNWLQIAWGSVTVWLPNNLYYAARKLMILAPIAFLFAAYGLIDVLFSKERFRKLWPILLLCALHLLLSAAWPVMKFRYLVPLLPFVFLLSLEQIQEMKAPLRLKHGIIAATFASIILLSFLTYRAIPTHTYYYDGAITQDAFHGNEELQYLRDHDAL